MDIEDALRWADTWGPVPSDPPSGDAQALIALAAEVRRLQTALKDGNRWMSQAHAMCSDLGVPHGHIEDRMFEAIGRVSTLLAIADAAQNLCKVKGRHHSEIAMRKLIEACGMMGPNAEVRGD